MYSMFTDESDHAQGLQFQLSFQK